MKDERIIARIPRTAETSEDTKKTVRLVESALFLKGESSYGDIW
mgnify:CR=1 FL=1